MLHLVTQILGRCSFRNFNTYSKIVAPLQKTLPKPRTITLNRNNSTHMSAALTIRQETKCFGGTVVFYTHDSVETKTPMNFSAFLPPQVSDRKCPVLYWLSGLTCTDENFITKAGAQQVAAELGLVLVCPDTSPRGANIEGEGESYDFGTGAGFYVDATESKWQDNYRMYSYVTKELPALVENNLPVLRDVRSVCGHSMGGHGALVTALGNPGMYRSVSAFAPICNPMNCPWGTKAFGGYLGEDAESWKKYDACELATSYTGPQLHILSDQGSEDNFLKAGQLLPENLITSCESNKDIVLTSREQDGYDHSYYFIATFIEEHLRFHANFLNQ